MRTTTFAAIAFGALAGTLWSAPGLTQGSFDTEEPRQRAEALRRQEDFMRKAEEQRRAEELKREQDQQEIQQLRHEELQAQQRLIERQRLTRRQQELELQQQRLARERVGMEQRHRMEEQQALIQNNIQDDERALDKRAAAAQARQRAVGKSQLSQRPGGFNASAQKDSNDPDRRDPSKSRGRSADPQQPLR